MNEAGAVKRVNADQFKNQSAITKAPADEHRIEINALRSFLAKAPALGSKAIRVRAVIIFGFLAVESPCF